MDFPARSWTTPVSRIAPSFTNPTSASRADPRASRSPGTDRFLGYSQHSVGAYRKQEADATIVFRDVSGGWADSQRGLSAAPPRNGKPRPLRGPWAGSPLVFVKEARAEMIRPHCAGPAGLNEDPSNGSQEWDFLPYRWNTTFPGPPPPGAGRLRTLGRLLRVVTRGPD